MMLRKTKIICTLGPAVDNEDMLKSVRDSMGRPVAAILDTKGPEIRIRSFETKSISLEAGDSFTLTTREVQGNGSLVSVTYPELHKEVSVGQEILIDDGLVALKVEEINGQDIRCVVENGGALSANKSINIPGVHIHLPALTEKDVSDIRFGVENDFDFIAASFVRRAADGAVRGVNWRFNAWGGEVDGLYAHWEKDDAFAGGLLDMLGFRGYDAAPFVMEGGAVHSDGEGTLLVTEACLLSAGRNPQLTKDEIAAALCRMLGAKKVLWLPRGIDGDETNEHVDNVCAFVRPGEVVLAWTDDPTDPQYACSQACLHYLEGETDAQGRRIRVHKLPIPRVPVLVTQEDLEGYTFEDGEDVREAGERLAASYVNYYCANGAIVLPAFGGENAASDAQAAAILAGLFPERRIISVYAREILTGGGNIHCITQQIPEGAKL